MRKVEIIKFCPNCGGAITRINDQLFCKNNTCSEVVFKKILHFVKTMKIKGLGEQTLKKLNVSSINDIYSMKEDNLIEILGEKIGTKIFNEIEKSKNVTLDIFIAAFSIPLVGKTIANKIATKVHSITDINAELCKEAGVGEKATNNLINWLKDEYPQFETLPINTAPIEDKEVNLQVCITGKLNGFTSRNKASEFYSNFGVRVVNSISSKVNYLICDDDSNSSKTNKARELNIPIITTNEFLSIIEEN